MGIKRLGFWEPPPIWTGQTAYILGGGPSLTQAAVDSLKGQRVIAINCSGNIAPWADILFFGDRSWLKGREEYVTAWAGLAVTSADTATPVLNLKFIVAKVSGRFPTIPGIVRKGPSSGHTAIGLAVALGSTRIVLLGYDMRKVDGRSHHHDEYAIRDVARFGYFIAGFAGWHADARQIGVEIVNATPNSALREFPALES